MYTKNQRKKHRENIDIHNEEREREDEDEENRQNTLSHKRQQQQQPQKQDSLSAPNSIFNISVPVDNEKGTVYISHLLYEADLGALVHADTPSQIKYFLDERLHMLTQMELMRTQYEKQYASLKRRLDESESENERLTDQYRLSSKELSLYKNLIESPTNSDSLTKSIRLSTIKLTIDNILEENQRLYAELNHFKTSDPVYDQVKLLEKKNKELKLKLTKIIEECEQLKLVNKKLLQQSQQHPTSSSPKQIHLSSFSASPLLIHHQRQLSPLSNRSSKSSLDENLPINYHSNEIIELREQVNHLEETLQKRDYELQKLQNEIEKGTSSIMSSIEDLCMVSSNVSSSSNIVKNQPTINELQNEIDQLHDKLDELIRENQILKTRTQEFDTVYEENEYLYAEKSQWNEELERSRIRQLILEQENYALKEREKEFFSTNDTTNNSNLSQLKLKIEWFNHTNNQLELEIVRLHEQMDLITKKYEQIKKDLNDKDKHYRQILDVAQDSQKLPQELVRLEKRISVMEIQFENERQVYEKTIAALEEQSEKREQKYSALYETIVKLQNDYRQKELDILHQIDEITKQRDTLHTQLTAFQHIFDENQQENRSLKEEISSKNEINRDLKLALTSSNNDTQSTYNQLRQLNTNLSDLQQKYDHDIAERNSQIELLCIEQKKLITNYDAELLKAHQTNIQLQHDNNQFTSQLEHLQLKIDKLQTEIKEKQNFIQQIQNDLAERSALHISINNQLTQENKVKMAKIIELEQDLSQEQQHKIELQRNIQELKNDLLKSRTIAKESIEKSEEFERRFHDNDKNYHYSNETNELTRREYNTLRNELLTKTDQNTELQHIIEDEKLKRQRLEMKLKRLKDEYINVRKELYNRTEDNNKIQHEIIEYRLKVEYYSQIYNQTLQLNDNHSSTAVQLYLKEKAETQHWQLKSSTYQQKFEQLQKNYETLKDKYKKRLHEERELYEKTKIKYLEHIKNVQKDLQETRQLLEKDTELKFNQESAYQQLVDERRQLLTSMIDKDAKVREMRRENLLLTSKIQLLENQMENLNERVDRTLRERSLLRRDVRLDSNVSIGTNARSSSHSPTAKTSSTTLIDSTGWTQPIYHTELYGYTNGHPYETSTVS